MSAKLHSALRASALALLLSSTILAGTANASTTDGTSPTGAPNSTINVQSNGNMASTPDTNVPGVAPQPMVNAPNDSGATADQGMRSGMHKAGLKHDGMHKPSPEMMKAHVEQRIKTLHDKLKITQDQEPAFKDVAQAMRDNESSMSSMIEERQANKATPVSAVDSLQSYNKIAQAHADGLKRVTASFTTLYNSLTPEQKVAADKFFSEAPMGGKHHKTAQ